ncbi:hypothetical protein BDR22DRAFT_854471 [Usnea florida]
MARVLSNHSYSRVFFKRLLCIFGLLLHNSHSVSTPLLFRLTSFSEKKPLSITLHLPLTHSERKSKKRCRRGNIHHQRF